MNSFVLKGDICHSLSPSELETGAYAVCIDGRSAGLFSELPERYAHLPRIDHSGKLILPGLVDLHMHAPQYAFRALGMDMELLDWLNVHTFPEEAKYIDLDYAEKAYSRMVSDLVRGPNTRVCLFATIHVPATLLLMDMLEKSGLICYVGKVNMDRNAPANLMEESAEASIAATRSWLNRCANYANVRPIITPRFIPACSDDLLCGLDQLTSEYDLPMQSHLSENPGEIAWVRALCPKSASYADAYDRYGLLHPNTIMAHCVWSEENELELLRERGVFVAHCPQSNANLASGIAPVRRFLDKDLRVGLGSDVAGGCHSSIFRAMADAISVSKLRWRLIDTADKPITVSEAFYLGTRGGGAFFGDVGAFDTGFEFDALVLDDSDMAAPFSLSIEERLTRSIYISENCHIIEKYARGKRVL